MINSLTTKLQRSMPKIGTHSGSFHCDEALGCWLLRQTKQFENAEIVRSRNAEILKNLDIVIDVGGVYDPEAYRFDHHQRDFNHVFGYGFNTKLSSAGLVYKHFGKEIIVNLLGWAQEHPQLHVLYLHVYKQFIEAVDAIDNGINQWDGDAPPKYVNLTTLSGRVGALNPLWNEPSSEEALYEQFLKAVTLTGEEFRQCVLYSAKAWLPARVYVKEALDSRFLEDGSGRIIKLSTVCPWKEHLYELEKELLIAEPILFCLYEDLQEKKWRIQAVSTAPGSFENRKSLPKAWRGLRDQELSVVCGVDGAVFVHAGGFIGGHNTFDGALAMAKLALSLE